MGSARAVGRTLLERHSGTTCPKLEVRTVLARRTVNTPRFALPPLSRGTLASKFVMNQPFAEGVNVRK